MIRRIVVLALLVGGALLLQPLRVPTEGVIAPRSLFLFGILLLAADTLGALARDLKLPRIVGYVIAGLVLGPSLAGLVPGAVLEDLGMMKRLAVGLIGLLAGMELRMDDLKQRWQSILAILVFQTLFVILVVAPAFMLASRWMPFASGYTFVPLALIALLFATMLAVNSPMVTLALIEENHAHGPVAKTTLGVVLVADVVVIVLFTIAYSLAQSALTGEAAGGLELALRLSREVGGSLFAGGVIGGILALYVRYVKRELVLFAVVLVFASAAAAEALHFELLLSLLVAGFLVENGAPKQAEPLFHALELVAGPVFVIFFAMTGGELELRAFMSLWPMVLAITLLRGGALVFGNRLGARLGGAEEDVFRFGWMGLVPQAGVALGFASLVAERLPEVGVGLQALTIGVITLNTSIGPVLFRAALARAGEIRPE
jgi:Kef-type K+ transport system membrane component KefB